MQKSAPVSTKSLHKKTSNNLAGLMMKDEGFLSSEMAFVAIILILHVLSRIIGVQSSPQLIPNTLGRFAVDDA